MNLEKAKTLLQKAYEEAKDSTFSNGDFKYIDLILESNHLTFKYILFTELLAKATDESIDPLSLQKGDSSLGSYDARSLAHKVVVPFEKTTLNKALGGSNEPFLNKPARYPRLSLNNPVRSKKDRELLKSLCENLPKLTTSELAYQELIYFLYKVIEIKTRQEIDRQFMIPSSSNTSIKILEFIQLFLQRSYEGQSLVLVVAGLYHLFYLDTAVEIKVHPVNQAGSSSKEVSDLDLYQNGLLKVANEIKDKNYTEIDVRHAIDKVIREGGNQLFFIQGIHSQGLTYDWLSSLIQEYQQQNFLLNIVYIDVFARFILGMIPNPNAYQFISYIRHIAENTKFKLEIINYIDEVARLTLGFHR